MSRSFNGSSDQILTGVVSASSITTQLSLSAWIKPSAFTNAYNGAAGVINTNLLAFAIFYTKSTGKMAWYTQSRAVSGVVTAVDPGTATLSVGTWYNIILTVTVSAANIMSTYVNGISDGTNNGGGPDNFQFLTEPLGIGFDNANPGRNFPGSIADVALWNVALTATEVTAIAQGARPFTVRPANLISYLPVDGLQSPEPDLSGNANNGTVTGAALASGPPFMPFTPRWPRNFEPPAVTFLPAFALGRNFVNEGIAT